MKKIECNNYKDYFYVIFIYKILKLNKNDELFAYNKKMLQEHYIEILDYYLILANHNELLFLDKDIIKNLLGQNNPIIKEILIELFNIYRQVY
jgi:hypothetical protein